MSLRYYVSEYYSGAIKEYRPNGSLIGHISHINGPQGIAVDSSGNLYVVACKRGRKKCDGGLPFDVRVRGLTNAGSTAQSSDFGIVLVYKPGSMVASKTLTDAGSDPGEIAVAPDGTVYVVSLGEDASTLVYANGSTTPTSSLPFPYPGSVGATCQNPATDAEGDLFLPCAAPEPYGITVWEYVEGSNSPKDLGYEAAFADYNEISAVAVTAAGDVVVDVPIAGASLPGGILFISSRLAELLYGSSRQRCSKLHRHRPPRKRQVDLRTRSMAVCGTVLSISRRSPCGNYTTRDQPR